MEKRQNRFLVGETVCMPRTTKYGSKGDIVVIVKCVKKGRHSYCYVQSKDGQVSIVPSKYLRLEKSRVTRNAIRIPVKDPSKPSINKPKKDPSKPSINKPKKDGE